MDVQQPVLDQPAQPARMQTPKSGVIDSLEGLRGLIEDMSNTQIAHTQRNLDQIISERLGGNADLNAVRRIFDRLHQ